MKTLKILSLILFVSLISCKEDFPKAADNDNITNHDIRSSVISRAVLQNKTMEEIRETLRSASPETRQALWIDKLNQAKSELGSTELKNAIDELIDELSLEKFDWDSQAADSFRNIFLVNWFANHNAKFGNEMGTAIFFNLYDFDPEMPGIQNQEQGGVDCNCDQSSYLGTCQFFGSECNTDECTSSSRGCGFLTFFTCNGMCEKDATIYTEEIK